MIWEQYAGSRFVVWIKVAVDPHDKLRGFSILDREMRVSGYSPVEGEMQDLRGEKMLGKFWVVEESEIYRAIPEMKKFPVQNKPWFFPVEFCESFIRPYNYLSFKVKETILPWE